MILFVMVFVLFFCYVLFLESSGNDVCLFGLELLNGSESMGERKDMEVKER